MKLSYNSDAALFMSNYNDVLFLFIRYSLGVTPYFSLKHFEKYDAVVNPTL